VLNPRFEMFFLARELPARHRKPRTFHARRAPFNDRRVSLGRYLPRYVRIDWISIVEAFPPDNYTLPPRQIQGANLNCQSFTRDARISKLGFTWPSLSPDYRHLVSCISDIFESFPSTLFSLSLSLSRLVYRY
jgi:hypothetical protein